MTDTIIDLSWVVGAADTCAIRVDDPYASPAHCRIDRIERGGGFLVTDLGTTNGTWIRNAFGALRRVVGTQRIQWGETLRVGRSELVWSGDQEFVFHRALTDEELKPL